MTTNSEGDRTGRRPDITWTPHQKEVLDLLARGNSNAQVAEALGLSLDGAKWHVREIMAILAVDSREDAADYWRARNGLRTRLRRGIAVALVGAASRWVAALAAVGGLAAFVAAIVLLGGGDDEPPQPASPSKTPSLVSGGTVTAEAEYLCPFEAPEVCAFAFETAAAFHPPDYGLSQLVAGSAWTNPEYYRQLADLIEAAFRFKSPGKVRLEDDGDIRLVSIACPVHGDFARCEPGFALTFADFGPLASATEGLEQADVVALVFEHQGAGSRPVLTGPLGPGDLPDIPTAIFGGSTPCNLLGLETRIQQCNGLLFRSTLIAPPDPTRIAGLAVRELVASDPVPLPEGITLYFNPTCYGCDGGVRTFRASALGGVLSIQELGPLPPGDVQVGAAYYMSRAIDADGRRMAMGVCDRFYCGGVAEAEPGASATLWLSEDGGATWTNHGDLPIWSYFSGFVGDQLMVSTWDDASQTRTKWLYPSGDPWPVPPSLSPGYAAPWIAPGGSVFWSQRLESTDHHRIYDRAGNLVLDRITPAYDTRPMGIGTDGELYLHVSPSSGSPSASSAGQVVVTSPTGEPVAAFEWAWGDLRLTAPIAPGVFIGNALFGPYPEPFGGAVNFRPAVIDLNEGTVSPIAGLPPDPASGIGGYAFAIVAVPVP